jgi:hypothetical protein
LNAGLRGVGRLVGMLAVAVLALQLFFLLRIALMVVVAPESTSFQRSEIWRIVVEKHQLPWSQESVPRSRISDNLRRAVIASEDAGFVEHHGVEWDAVEKAWNKNEKARRASRRSRGRTSTRRGADGKPRVVVAKVVGGSTISQQLAKNLFLSGERNILRKGQELVITLMLELRAGQGAHPHHLPEQRRMGRRRVRRAGRLAALLPHQRGHARPGPGGAAGGDAAGAQALREVAGVALRAGPLGHHRRPHGWRGPAMMAAETSAPAGAAVLTSWNWIENNRKSPRRRPG